MQKNTPFELTLKNALIPSIIVVFFMWLVFLIDYVLPLDLYQWGVLSQSLKGLWGIIFMPLIHADENFKHIINNSIPTFVLLTALFYSYKDVALKVFILSWILTGVFVWIFAAQSNAYHIGMSGVIYALAAFLFTSGVIRRFFPLQALSLFVIFLYGSLIWGIFPIEPKVSWQGHLMGMIIGIWLAFYFRKEGPKRPKFQYEIEKELGIEPPDLEGMYNQRLLELEELRKQQKENENQNTVQIVYHYTPQVQENQNSILDSNDEKK